VDPGPGLISSDKSAQSTESTTSRPSASCNTSTTATKPRQLLPSPRAASFAQPPTFLRHRKGSHSPNRHKMLLHQIAHQSPRPMESGVHRYHRVHSDLCQRPAPIIRRRVPRRTPTNFTSRYINIDFGDSKQQHPPKAVQGRQLSTNSA